MTRRRRLVAGWAGAGALLTLPLLVALVLLIAAPVALADGAWVYQGSFGSTGSGAGQFGTDVGNIAYDGHGVLYIADHDNDRIEQWTTAGSYIQSWGTGGSGDGLLDEPFGFALDHNGDCYITDEYDGSVQKFDVAGNWVATLAVGSSVSLGVAVDSSGGTWVSDSSGSNVYKFDADGNQLFKVDTSESGPLDTPTGIACDSAGNAYIADSGNGRVVVFSQYGQFLRQWQTAYEPWSIAVDSAGHVFVGERSLFDASEANVTEFNRAGNEITSFGQGRFGGAVYGIAVDGKGHLWAADSWRGVVEEYAWDQPAITTDADGDWHSQPTVVHFTADDPVSGIKELDYSTDGGTTWQQDDSVAIDAPADHSNDGVHTVQVKATSNDGNSTTVSFKVKIDTKAPTITSDYWFYFWSQSPQTVPFKASDVGSGVGGLYYSIDGNPAQPVGDDGNATIFEPDGIYDITYWAVDNCVDQPNESTHEDAALCFDSTPPVVAALANVAVVRGKKATFRFTVHDALSRYCHVEIPIFKKGKLVKTVILGTRAATSAAAQKALWTCKLPKGTYTWKMNAWDEATNFGLSAAKKLTVK